MVLADRLEEAGSPGGVADVPAHLGEGEVDSSGPQRLDQLLEVLGGRDVELRVRAEVEDHGARRLFLCAGEALHGVADERGVRVEHRGLEPQHEETGRRGVVGVAVDVAVGVRDVRDASEHGDVRPARVVHDEQHHRHDAEHEARQHVDRDHADARADPDPELERPLAPVLPELRDLPEMRDGVDDQRGEHRLRQVLEERASARAP